MTQELFDFADDTAWSNERLRDRALYLGEHILIINKGSDRYNGISREIGHVVFELSARNLLAQEESV